MKKIKDFWIVISCLVLTTLVYFQSWLGPVKNWKRIIDYPNYPTAGNEWLISDAFHFVNTSQIKINTTNTDFYSFILTSYSFVNQVVINLLSKLTNNINLAVNLFDFLGYLIVVLVSFKVFNALKVNKIYSFVFSLLFAFTFYHQMQGLNPLMSWYFCVPAYCYFALKLFDVTDLTINIVNKKFVILLLLSGFILPLFGLAYAVIGNLIILTAGFLNYFSLVQNDNKKIFKNLIFSYLLISVISFLLVINLNQYLLNYDGYPLQVQVEQNSFKLVQLLLPNIFHRNTELSALTDFYASFFPSNERNIFTLMPINGENMSVALGFVASAGFVFVLIAGVFSLMGKFSLHRLDAQTTATQNQSFLNNYTLTQQGLRKTFPLLLVILLVGSFGGLGGLVAMAIPALGIEWFRASPFIHFLLLLLIASLLQEFIGRYISKKLKKISTLLIASLFLIVGLYDQVPAHCGNCGSDGEELTKQTQLFFENKMFENSSASEWLQLPSTSVNMVSPSSFQYLFLQNSMQQYLLPVSNQASMRFESEQVQARLKYLMPSFSLEDQVLVAQYLGMSGVVINKTNWCDWQTELPKLVQTFSLSQAVEVPAFSKTNFDSLQAFRLNKPLITEQQQRLNNLLQQHGFKEINGKLYDQFDWAKGIDFAAKEYPPYVKNIEGLIGEKNIQLSQTNNLSRCVSTVLPANENKVFSLVSWGDLFPNPLSENKVLVNLHSGLPQKFKLKLSANWVDATYPSKLKQSQVPLELLIGQKKQLVELGTDLKEMELNFELDKLQELNEITLTSRVPIIHLTAFQQSPDVDGVIVLRSIQIEPVKP